LIGVTLLQLTHGYGSVGLYAVAGGVAGLILIVQSAVVVPFFPAATEQYARGVERLRLTTFHTSRYLVILVFPLCLLAVLFGREVMTFLYTPDFASAALALGYLSAVSLLLSYAGPVGYIYYVLKLMPRFVLLNLIWFMLFVAGVFLFVPSGSFEGLALATLIVFLIHMHLGLLFIRDKYEISQVYRLMLATECLAIGLAGLAFLTVNATFILRLGLSVIILGFYPVVLRYGFLSDQDMAFLRGLIMSAVAKFRGTPPATPEPMKIPPKGFYEGFHEKTQAPSGLLSESDFTYGNLTAFIRRHLPRRARVLDIGCGNGAISSYTASLGCEVLALDISERAVAQAMKGAEALGIRGLTFVTADFTQFTTDERFDAILCFDVLEHIPDDHSAIAKIAGLLKPGGKLIMRTPSSKAFLHRLRLGLFGHDAFDESVGHLRRYASQEIVRELSTYGFRILEIQPVEGVLRNSLYTTSRGNRLLRYAQRPRVSALVTAADEITMRLLGDSGFNLVAVLEAPRSNSGA